MEERIFFSVEYEEKLETRELVNRTREALGSDRIHTIFNRDT